MASEKSEGLEVRGYEVEWPEPYLPNQLHGPDWILAGRVDAPPHFPLVRLSDHRGEVERAREEGHRDGLRDAFRQDRSMLEGVCAGHPNTREGNARIGSFVRGVLKQPLPVAPPDREGGAG